MLVSFGLCFFYAAGPVLEIPPLYSIITMLVTSVLFLLFAFHPGPRPYDYRWHLFGAGVVGILMAFAWEFIWPNVAGQDVAVFLAPATWLLFLELWYRIRPPEAEAASLAEQ